jgi:hypothetical protein
LTAIEKKPAVSYTLKKMKSYRNILTAALVLVFLSGKDEMKPNHQILPR